MTIEHKNYSFTLVLKNVMSRTENLEDSLYESGCDDALIHFKGNTVYLDFDRKSSSLEEAVISAIQSVESSSIGAKVAHVEPEDLVSESDMAKRLNKNRQILSLWVKGERRANHPFPHPIMKLSDWSPFWRWSEVAKWLHKNNLLSQKEEVENSYFLMNLNEVLAERDLEIANYRQNLLKKLDKKIIKNKILDIRKSYETIVNNFSKAYIHFDYAVKFSSLQENHRHHFFIDSYDAHFEYAVMYLIKLYDGHKNSLSIKKFLENIKLDKQIVFSSEILEKDIESVRKINNDYPSLFMIRNKMIAHTDIEIFEQNSTYDVIVGAIKKTSKFRESFVFKDNNKNIFLEFYKKNNIGCVYLVKIEIKKESFFYFDDLYNLIKTNKNEKINNKYINEEINKKIMDMSDTEMCRYGKKIEVTDEEIKILLEKTKEVIYHYESLLTGNKKLENIITGACSIKEFIKFQ